MADVYTTVINSETPTEITGGRVGWFRVSLEGSSIVLGGSTLAADYSGAPTVQVAVNGFVFQPGESFYVTSPDEVYGIFLDYNGGSFATKTLTVYHNR